MARHAARATSGGDALRQWWRAASVADQAAPVLAVEEEVRTSVFGRSETLIQLSWVIGGMLGVIPVAPGLGMAIVAVLMVGMLIITFFGNRLLLARRDRMTGSR